MDPPVGPVSRAPTVSGVDLLVANEGRVIVPRQDRSRRWRWPKASLYKGLSLGHVRPTEGDVGVRPTRGRPNDDPPERAGGGSGILSTPWVNSRERQGSCDRRVRSAPKIGPFAMLIVPFLEIPGRGGSDGYLDIVWLASRRPWRAGPGRWPKTSPCWRPTPTPSARNFDVPRLPKWGRLTGGARLSARRALR